MCIAIFACLLILYLLLGLKVVRLEYKHHPNLYLNHRGQVFLSRVLLVLLVWPLSPGVPVKWKFWVRATDWVGRKLVGAPTKKDNK